MSFPVGGTSVALGINLPASACGGTKPAAIQLTTSLASRLLGGDIKTWDDAGLRAGGLNPGLANCHVNVTRVVRSDSSTTTQILKNYLVNADDSRSTSVSCFLGGHWDVFATPANDTLWPIGGACSTLANGGSPGPGPQLTTCASTTGAVCYGDLSDVLGQATLIRPSIRNAVDTAFAPPSISTRANCSFGTLILPANTDAGAVGLDAQDTWATDNPSGNRGDATFTGSAYPICELAFALVDTGLRSGNTTARLTYDQRQTLYAFISYALSSAGQDRVGSAGFASMPVATVSSERRGFQSNY
jgi:ABC-type phosphate transport system substrate-binding protein